MVIFKAPSATVDTTSGEAFKTAASLCYETGNPPECFNNLVIEKLPVYGFKAVSKAYMEFVSADGSSIQEQCHRSAHYLGEYAGETIPVVDDALKAGGNFCQFGYYHGVIEGHAKVSENLWDELPYLCLKITKDQESTVYGECIHSLGHAIVTRTNYDIDVSLKKCLLLPVYEEQTSCGRGVFMSWSNELDLRANSGQSLPAEFTQGFALGDVPHGGQFDGRALCTIFRTDDIDDYPRAAELHKVVRKRIHSNPQCGFQLLSRYRQGIWRRGRFC